MADNGQLLNYVNNEWRKSSSSRYLDVLNPATAECITSVPLSPAEEMVQAIEIATA